MVIKPHVGPDPWFSVQWGQDAFQEGSDLLYEISEGFPGGSDGEESSCKLGDSSSIPGSERSPGEGNGNPLLYSCLGNPMDRRAWQATVHGVTNSWTGLND